MLKDRIIKALDDQPLLFSPDGCMTLEPDTEVPIRFNLVGLILKFSGLHIQSGMWGENKLPLNAPTLYRAWIEFEQKMVRHQTYCSTSRLLEIHGTARQLWAEEYGEASAMALPFYDFNSHIDNTCYWDLTSEVTREDIQAYLMCGACYKLNSSYGLIR